MTTLLEWEHEGEPFIGTPQQLVDELSYANYCYNRQQNPTVTPKEWEAIYGEKTRLMEVRYQQEQASHASSFP